jgi:two-component sensor histidine kinase
MADRLATGPLTTIRFRLGVGLALALFPVLLLGAAQAMIDFRKDAVAERTDLTLAAERSAATARARMVSAGVLLDTLAPQAVGLDCAQRLAEITRRLPSYDNLIRFDANGRVVCAANTTPYDPARRTRGWFAELAAGAQQVAVRAPPELASKGPAVFLAQRVKDSAGRFDGAQAAVIGLESLRPDPADRALPAHTEIALVDRDGRVLTRTEPAAVAAPPAGFAETARETGAVVYSGAGTSGQRRINTVAPLAGDVFVVLSAPAPGLFSWARLNPLSSLFLPLLAFFAALAAVWVVTERGVLRWLHYLQRIAALYAKGRLSVRPLQAEYAPAEIHDLALTLEEMAESIDARDGSLRASLDEKDALMREIHHRVKNNLQVISSLLSLQERALTDPTARGAMADTRRRIAALALIYRALYQGVDLKRVNLRLFLGDLMGQLVMEQQASGRVVRTELEADDLIIDPDKLAPFALFAVEAISNAQKHALAINGGLLRVNFIVGEEEAVLTIADEGAGAPPQLTGGGVGRTLMTAFARQLRGRMDLTPNNVGGVTARLTFPTPDIGDSQTGGQPPRSKPRGNRVAA